jgi:hypothetical protein
VQKYGAANIRIQIVNCESEQAAFELEKIYIKQLRESGAELVNMTDGGEGTSGLTRGPLTKERKKKISEANKGNTFRRGSTHTPEAKEKMRTAHAGRVLTEKQKTAAVGNSYRKGAKHTDEAKEKNRIAHLGIKQSAETIEKRRVKLKKPRQSKNAITGVYWYKPSCKWLATVRHDGKTKHLGYFDCYFEACCARKSAEILVYGIN